MIRVGVGLVGPCTSESKAGKIKGLKETNVLLYCMKKLKEWLMPWLRDISFELACK